MQIDFGGLRRTEPISRHFGYDRGLPVDRHYIKQFLGRYRKDITGRALEIGDDSYTRQFGGDQVTMRDILHVHEGNPKATIVSDLSSSEGIPSDAFDCAIVTQTLQCIFEPFTALRTLHRILKPGGVLLATVPGIIYCDSSRVCGQLRYVGLSRDREPNGATVAAFQEFERTKQRRESAHAGERVYCIGRDHSQYVCHRSELSSWLRA